jgi:hypothetical protein
MRFNMPMSLFPSLSSLAGREPERGVFLLVELLTRRTLS